MDVLKFTVLDDKTHIIGPGEYTVCGLRIPFGNGYVTDAPAKGLCSECKSRAKDTDEFGMTREAFEEAAPDLPYAAPEPEAEPAEEPAPKPKPAAKAKASAKPKA